MPDRDEPLFRVLVVEDEPRLRELLLHALPDMGLQGLGARSGEEALRLMAEDPHEGIILDLNLPGMTGFEFLQQVRDRWPTTSVLILTGYGDLDAARQAIHLDVVDFLTKPTPLGELEKSLERARRRWQEKAMPKGKPALPPAGIPAPRSSAPISSALQGADTPPGESAMADADSRQAFSTETRETEDAEAWPDHARTLDELERSHILAALERNEGNRTATAAELGISLRTLYYRLSEYQKQGYLPSKS